MPAYKLKPNTLPLTSKGTLLRSIGRGIWAVNNLAMILGLIGTYTGVLAPIAGPIAIGAMLGEGPSYALKKTLEAEAHITDIKGLIGSRDMAALKILFNRTRKLKNLLDPYEKWEDVPEDLKRSIANYVNDYYPNVAKLQNALYLAQAQANKNS